MAYSETEMETSRRDRPASDYPGTTPSASLEKEAREIKGEAKAAAGEMKQEVKQLTEEAKQRGQALFEGQRHAAAEEIGGMVDALRRTSEQLYDQDRPSTARFADQAAQSLDRIAGTLRNQDMRTMYRNMEGYARQHPGMFFGGSIVVGFFLARFLKSSQEDRPYGASHGSGERYQSESRYVF